MDFGNRAMKMNAPLNRDRQIELMRTAEARRNESSKRWKKNAQFRAALSARPEPKSGEKFEQPITYVKYG